MIINKLRLLVRMHQLKGVYKRCYTKMQKNSTDVIAGNMCPGLIHAADNYDICENCPHYFARRRD